MSTAFGGSDEEKRILVGRVTSEMDDKQASKTTKRTTTTTRSLHLPAIDLYPSPVAPIQAIPTKLNL